MDENEEIKTRQINAVIEFLGRTFPDPRRAKDDLHKFAKMNESRLYVLLKKLMDPQSDLKTILKIYVRRSQSRSDGEPKAYLLCIA